VLSLPVPALGGSQDDLLYGEIARRWLERNGQEAETSLSWTELLETRFAHLGLGVYDVYLPADALRDPKAVKAASGALQALVACQEGWASWIAGQPTTGPTEPMRKWLQGLAPKQFGNRSAAGADLLVLTQADEGLVAEFEHYAHVQRAGKALGSAKELQGVRLVVFPRRGEFVEFTCLAGQLDGRLRPTAWNGGLTTWLEYQADDTRFLSLEYCTTESARNFDKGVGVGERNPGALSQLVAQVGTRGLLARVAPELDPALASGLANTLVIDLYEELDTRIDGDVRSRSSQGSSTFVPGGNPNGGVLPQTSAENRWRGTKGRDHFVGVLAQVQKQSGKKAPKDEKLACFELRSDSGSAKETVRAPFLGSSAQRPGDPVFPDYLEFVRCYSVAFLHWLRVGGAGAEPETSARLFGEFLGHLSRGTKTEDVPALLERIYGQPLSGGSTGEIFEHETLEGRFLAWLAKQS